MTGRRIIPRIASTYEHHDLVLNALKPCSGALPTRTLYGLTRDAHSIMCQTLIWLRFNKRCNPSMETVSGSFKRSKAVLEFPPDRITQEEQTLLVQVIAAKRLSLGPPGRRAFYVASKCIGTFTQARLGHRPEHVAIDHRLSDEHQPARDHVNFLHKHEKLENAAGPRPFTVNDPADANKYPIVFFKLSVQSGLILTLSLIFV